MQSIQVGRPNCSLHFANLKVLRLNEPYVPHLMVTGSFKTHVMISNTYLVYTLLQKLSKCEVKAWLCWNLIILPPLRFCVKSHFGEFKRSKNVIYGNFRDTELWILVNSRLESCSDLLKIKIQNLWNCLKNIFGPVEFAKMWFHAKLEWR